MILLRRQKRMLTLVGGCFLVLLISLTLLFLPPTEKSGKAVALPQPSSPPHDAQPFNLDGYVKSRVGISPGTIYLVENCTAIITPTTHAKAYTIQRGLENVLDKRPDEYDLFFDLLDHYRASIKLVKIYRPDDGTYSARILVDNGLSLLSLDAKPSDALALAARFSAPVYVEEKLFERYGENVC